MPDQPARSQQSRHATETGGIGNRPKVGWKPIALAGWGRTDIAQTRAARPERRGQAISAISAADTSGVITYGGGRSYGDVALNNGGRTILTARLNRILDFDAATGDLVVEPGVTFKELLETFLPRGFMVPVSPGTAYATVGGAVANDVHGKNHPVAGSFGDHVRWLELLLPSGEVVRTSPSERSQLFAATVGGIGLTGVILATGFRLGRVPSNALRVSERRIADLGEFIAAYDSLPADQTYAVGWIDCLAKGKSLGRGILQTAAPAGHSVAAPVERSRQVPCNFPSGSLNRWSVQAFNALYWRRVPSGGRQRTVACRRFFYPLDSLHRWNRIYGRRGFRQFQCVVPKTAGEAVLRRLLTEIAASGRASFLAVLKTLGGRGRGYLSFPMCGYTLALDFPNTPGVDALLQRLQRITLSGGGRIYLAKDSCLSAEAFATMYPDLGKLRQAISDIDPTGRMASNMARRLRIRAGSR